MTLSIMNQGKEQFSSPVNEILKSTLSSRKIFVVQRHLSSVLHYDLRIEVNGVLKSWAIPNGPSMNAGDRRLAVMINDQPLDYASFRGVVPRGKSAADIVEQWDRGEYVPHSLGERNCDDADVLCNISYGRLKFTLKGKKLKGVFTLVKLENGQSNHWVLIKGNDKFSVDHPYSCEHYITHNSPINRFMEKVKPASR